MRMVSFLLLGVLVLGNSALAGSQDSALERTITVQEEETTLAQLLETVTEDTGISFSVVVTATAVDRLALSLTVMVREAPLEEVLDLLARHIGFEYVVEGDAVEIRFR